VSTSREHARLLALARSAEPGEINDFALALLARGIVRTGSGRVSLSLFEQLAGLPQGYVMADIWRHSMHQWVWPVLFWSNRAGGRKPYTTPEALAGWLRDQVQHRYAPGIRRALDRIAA